MLFFSILTSNRRVVISTVSLRIQFGPACIHIPSSPVVSDVLKHYLIFHSGSRRHFTPAFTAERAAGVSWSMSVYYITNLSWSTKSMRPNQTTLVLIFTLYVTPTLHPPPRNKSSFHCAQPPCRHVGSHLYVLIQALHFLPVNNYCHLCVLGWPQLYNW